jgi:transposase
VVVTIITRDEEKVQKKRRVFSTTLAGLLALDDWLEKYQIHILALKSVGMHKHLVADILETERIVIRLNAHHLKTIAGPPGHKGASRDSDWLANALHYGLLEVAFNPPRQTSELRELVQYRRKLVREQNREIHDLREALEAITSKITPLTTATDVCNATKNNLFAALQQEEHDPVRWSRLVYGWLQEKFPELRQDLKSQIQPHYRFLIHRILEHIDFLEKSRATVQAELEKWISAAEYTLPQAHSVLIAEKEERCSVSGNGSSASLLACNGDHSISEEHALKTIERPLRVC